MIPKKFSRLVGMGVAIKDSNNLIRKFKILNVLEWRQNAIRCINCNGCN